MIGLFDNRRVGGGIVIIERKSTPYSDIELPKNVTDPLYTSSQASLNTLGSELLTGDVPDYYKSIGDFNSPQFQAMLNSVKGQVMQGSQEASAISGTGRSGVATTASNNALNQIVPQLTYQDYLRAVQGRGALLDTGINVESGVRGSSQNQQQFDTNFNQTLFQDKVGLASLMDSWKKEAAKEEGQQFGNILKGGMGAVTGGITGFLTGGPVGAAIGAVGGGINGFTGTGGGSSGDGGLSQLFSSLSGIKSPSNTASYGISDSSLGSFKNLSSLNSGNFDISALLNGGR